MDARYVTCRSIGVYGHALTRGKNYEVLKEENDKYRVTGDHGKRLWIDKYYFIEGISEVPILISWHFDDDVNKFELVEVTLNFSDGAKRWCIVTTPEKLIEHFKDRDPNPPGFNIQNLIIIKTLKEQDVEKTLKYLDEQDELIKASRVLVVG